MSEQTELRALADAFAIVLVSLEVEGAAIWVDRGDVSMLRRAADRLDRLTALVARLEEEGDV